MMSPRGRPKITDELAAARAVRLINIALAIRNRQVARLAAMGLTESEALELVLKRYRGKVGHFLGGDLVELVAPVQNRTAVAVQHVLDFGESIRRVADRYGLDRRSLVRAVRRGWDERAVAVIRRATLASRMTVTDFSATEPHTRMAG